LEYCGNRVYSISSVKNSAAVALTATELTIDSSTGLISLYTSNSATVGTHAATVSVSLNNYASVASCSVTFTITINPCIVTQLQVVQLSDFGDL